MKASTLLMLFAPFWVFAIDIVAPMPLEICDDNNDGVSVFDLTAKDAEITGGLPGYTVTYYETMLDAQTETNPIFTPTAYYNIVNPQTLHVRVVNVNDASDFGLTALTIRVFPTPSAVVLPWLTQCDDDGDGLGTFDLTSSIDYAQSSQPMSTSVAVYETVADAESGTSPVASPYTTTVPIVQTLYIRITASEGCYVIQPLYLRTPTIPVSYPIDDFVVYQQPYIGTAYFWLGEAGDQVVNGQNDVWRAFYPTQADAIANTNALQVCHNSTSAMETIWVRTYSTYGGECYSLSSFDIIVSPDANPNPIVSIPDTNFKNKLLQFGTARTACGVVIDIDANHDGDIQTDEAARVGNLNVNNSGIQSLEGVKAFLNMYGISCYGNQLTELDLAGMTTLDGIECGGNQLAALDLSETGVSQLSCAGNNLIWINMKNNVTAYSPVHTPSVWGSNPLQYVCIDENEVSQVEGILDFSNLTGVILTSDCSMLGTERQRETLFTIYPNPVQSTVNIESANVIRQIIVLDMQGRRVAKYRINETQATVDMSGLTKGLYLLQLSTDFGQSVQKLIKQ